MAGFETNKLSAIEDDFDVPGDVMSYRPIKLMLSVKSFSDQNAIDIGQVLLQAMRDEGLIGPNAGDAGLDFFAMGVARAEGGMGKPEGG